MEKEIVGICTGETNTTKVSYMSKTLLSVGEFVYLEYNSQKIIGMIDSVFRGSKALNSDDMLSPESIKRILDIEGDVDNYLRGNIILLGDEDNLEIPKTPAPPGTEVIKADTELLKKIFEKEDAIRLGSLVSDKDVPVKIDVNKMVSRHLAILAMTGSGKSNTTSIIIDRLLEVNGTMIVFDMHGEYENTQFTNGEIHIIKPLINPRDLSISEYKRLAKVTDNAVNQERYLRDAYDYADDSTKEGDDVNFLITMEHYIDSLIDKAESDNTQKKYIDSMRQTLYKLKDIRKIYGKILESTDTEDIVSDIEVGKVNIINLNSVDEIGTDIVVNHTLKNILIRRKRALSKNYGKNAKILEFPIFCIIEEAHMLASEKINTKSKGIIGQIAREGRKFGVGLCLISQSPKSLDSASLSQINNRIILRLVEPGDQKHVQSSSESLSEDLLKQLPSLNIGEAILLGQMTNIPTMVKIDKFEGKSLGEDLNILELWKKTGEEKKVRVREQKASFNEFD